MSLRPENLLAFKNAHIPLSVLLHPESLQVPTTDLASLGVRFALVDHNRLLPQFVPTSGDTTGLVHAVIDHHDDEGLYKDAEIRMIKVPTGSASSLVTKHFMPQWQAALSGPAAAAGSPIPNELATLLMSAQLIDTHGLKIKEGGKATPVDLEAAAFLYPLTPWAAGDSVTPSSLSTSTPEPVAEQNALLSEAKFNVSYLSTHDLLLRDYKEYTLPTASFSFPNLRVGLSTVPLGLKDWLERDGNWPTYLAAADKFTVERNLDVEGVLTTFKSKKGNSKRELLLLVRVGGALDDKAAKRVMAELEEGLAGNEELGLEPWEKKGWKRFLKREEKHGLDGERRYGRVWTQGNAGATRKKVAPIMVSRLSPGRSPGFRTDGCREILLPSSSEQLEAEQPTNLNNNCHIDGNVFYVLGMV
jgi:exopolyphosphatase